MREHDAVQISRCARGVQQQVDGLLEGKYLNRPAGCNIRAAQQVLTCSTIYLLHAGWQI